MDAPTTPLPTFNDTTVRALVFTPSTTGLSVQMSMWEQHRIRDRALCRRPESVMSGGGICPVLDARIVGNDIVIELLVPNDAQPPGANEVPPVTPGSWSPERVARLLTPVVDSLAVLHDAGIAHGDIGLSTIWQRGDGRGVLVGFDPDATMGADVAQMADLVLGLVAKGTLDGQTAALLTRAADGFLDTQPTMADLGRVLSGMATRPVEVQPGYSPLAQRSRIGTDDGDPITRLRASGRHMHAPKETASTLRSTRGRARRSRGRSAPGGGRIAAHWQLIAAIAGSSAFTWMLASRLG